MSDDDEPLGWRTMEWVMFNVLPWVLLVALLTATLAMLADLAGLAWTAAP